MSETTGSAGPVAWRLRGPEVFARPDAWQGAWETALRGQLTPIGQGIRAEAQAAYARGGLGPAQLGTRIANAFTMSTSSRSPNPYVRLTNTDPLFAVVEYPTRPHVITARVPGGRLAFMGNAGHLVRPFAVNHPGTRGRLAVDPILARWEPAFTAALDRAAQIASDA